MTLPAYKDIGTPSETAPAWPTHVAGDCGLLLVEVANESAVTPSGWTALSLSPAISGSVTRLFAYVRIATSSSESAPTIPGVAANHAYAVIVTFSGVHPTVPVHTEVSDANPGSTSSGRYPGLVTSINDCLIVIAISRAGDLAGALSSAEANTSLANVAERFDDGTTSGNGGGLVVITGEFATAGTVVHSTNTWSTSQVSACITLALAPASSAPDTTAGQHNRIVNAGM